jgi:hypothetical protein
VIVLVATDMERPSSAVRRASDAGAAGVHIGAGRLLGELPDLAAEALGAGLGAATVTLPLGERALAAGKRLPHLAAADPDERAAAVALAREGLAAASAMGITRVLLDLGEVALPVARNDVERLHRRRALGEGEPGAARLATALAARKARGQVLFDACRFALERLARDAEARGARLLLPVAGTPWEVPSPREAEALLAALAGAPLAPVWDPARLSVLRSLELPLAPERVAWLASSAGAALEGDAVGMQAGYLPGLGERDPELPARADLPRDAPVIVAGTGGATAAELAEAVREVTARYA